MSHLKHKSTSSSLSWNNQGAIIKCGITDFKIKMLASDLFNELTNKGLSYQDIESIFQNLGMNLYDSHVKIINEKNIVHMA